MRYPQQVHTSHRGALGRGVEGVRLYGRGVCDSPSRPSFPLFPLHPPPVGSLHSLLPLVPHVAVHLLVPSPASFITFQSPHPLHPPDFRPLQISSAFDLPASPELDSSTNLHQLPTTTSKDTFQFATGYNYSYSNISIIDHYQSATLDSLHQPHQPQ